MLTENIGVLLKDFGVPCAAAGYSFTGIFDAPDDTLNMGGINVLSTMYRLTAQTSDVLDGAIESGSVLTVNGSAFVVRDVISVDDGVFSHLTLSK
ncbi:MAG: hypothetical protein WCH44_17795 [Betaproteobacteria bacterium]